MSFSEENVSLFSFNFNENFTKFNSREIAHICELNRKIAQHYDVSQNSRQLNFTQFENGEVSVSADELIKGDSSDVAIFAFPLIGSNGFFIFQQILSLIRINFGFENVIAFIPHASYSTQERTGSRGIESPTTLMILENLNFQLGMFGGFARTYFFDFHCPHILPDYEHIENLSSSDHLIAEMFKDSYNIHFPTFAVGSVDQGRSGVIDDVVAKNGFKTFNGACIKKVRDRDDTSSSYDEIRKNMILESGNNLILVIYDDMTRSVGSLVDAIKLYRTIRTYVQIKIVITHLAVINSEKYIKRLESILDIPDVEFVASDSIADFTSNIDKRIVRYSCVDVFCRHFTEKHLAHIVSSDIIVHRENAGKIEVKLGMMKHKKKSLLGFKKNDSVYCLFGGKISPNEKIHFCALRELFEESGMFVNIPSHLEYFKNYTGSDRDSRYRLATTSVYSIRENSSIEFYDGRRQTEFDTRVWISLSDIFDTKSDIILAYDHLRILKDWASEKKLD